MQIDHFSAAWILPLGHSLWYFLYVHLMHFSFYLFLLILSISGMCRNHVTPCTPSSWTPSNEELPSVQQCSWSDLEDGEAAPDSQCWCPPLQILLQAWLGHMLKLLSHSFVFSIPSDLIFLKIILVKTKIRRHIKFKPIYGVPIIGCFNIGIHCIMSNQNTHTHLSTTFNF